jgi:hypothetical protein
MSETTKTNPEVTQPVAAEGGEMKMKSKPKPKKFKATKEQPIKIDLSKVDTSLEANAKVEAPIKVDLTKKSETDAIQIGETKTVDVGEQAGDGKVVDIGGDKPVTESSSPLEEVTEVEEKQVQQPVVQSTKVELPENIEKLVSFMQDTGGTVQDYVRLNADYSTVNEDTLLKEYYKKAKPHLDQDEVEFVLEEAFSFDDEIDEERDIKKKKLAKKEAVVEAREFLEDLKKEYYDEIKLRPGVNQEQQKAMEFFNRYNDEQQLATQQHERFVDNTKQLLNDEFKGFDFEVGEKKFRYGVKDPNAVAENQSNLNNFVGKFLDTEGNVKDTKGYHKAMYAAQNIDKIVNHFYEQGKTDGIKNVVEGSKNPSTTVRQEGVQDIFIGGLKVRAIDGVSSSKLKIKKSKFNN